MESNIISLRKQLDSNKIFLNMVIHDMRNPCNAAEFGMQQIIELIDKANAECNDGSIKNIKSVRDDTNGKQIIIDETHSEGHFSHLNDL